MREIKFRVWDKEEKFMVEPFRLQNLSFEAVSNKNNVFMQYTGLKDKNGKEIYEGDIVFNEPNSIYLIKWCNGGFVALENGKHRRDIESQMLCTYEFEVIGNIYENPELLK